MGLAETQRLLAHLYTEHTLCERFFADPETVGREWGLGREDIVQVIHLSQAQVTYFARSLVSKRRGEVAKLLPRTCDALGSQFIPLFGRYAETFVPSGVKKHRNDALAFARFLEQSLTKVPMQPPWLLDLLHYESAWLTISERRLGLIIHRHHYAVSDPQSTPSPRPSIVFWIRFSSRGPVRHFVLPFRKLSYEGLKPSR